MRKRRWRPGLRGMALILTLFTIAVLVTLSTSFAILAFNESRSSRSSKEGKLAYEFACSGVNAMAAYMGANINWSENSLVADPITGVPPSYSLVAPTAVGTLSPWSGFLYYPPGATSPVTVPLTVSSLTQVGPSGVANPNFTWSVLVNKGQAFAIDSQHDAALSLVVQRAGLPGDPDALASPGVPGGDLNADTSEVYLIRSTATLYANGGGDPIAMRTVVARIREVSSDDYSLYLQASRFFDAPGLAKYYTNVTAAAALKAMNQNFTDLSGTGGISFGTQLQGQVNMLNAPSISPYQTNGQAGGITLWGDGSTDFTAANIASGSVTHFGGNVAVGQSTTGIQFPQLGATPAGLMDAVFGGGDSGSQGTELPGSMPGENAATQYSTQSNSLVTGTLAGTPMVTVNSSQSSDFGETQPLLSGAKAPSGPVGKDIEIAVDASGNPIDGAPPGIANVKITLNNPRSGDGGSITVQLVGAYSGAPVPFGPNDFRGVTFESGSPSSGSVTIGINSLDQLNGGLFYVDGGNVQVGASQIGGGNGQDITGRLTIVAGGSSQRPTVDDTDPMDPVLIVYDAGNATSDGITGSSIYLDPSNTNFFPTGSSGAVFPFENGSGQWYWPAWNPNTLASPTIANAYDLGNTTILSDMMSRDDAATREGNLVITSSINAASGTNPNLGLIAENYIFLSDLTNPADDTLNVDATLQSLAHSVEWAGFNDGIKIDPEAATKSQKTVPGAYYVGMASGQVGTKATANTWGIPPAPNGSKKFTTEASAGHFNLTGSIISPFMDEEGTFMEGPPGSFLGYPNQQTILDPTTAADPPPFLPTFSHNVTNNPANALNIVNYKIESITDLGALSGH